MTEKLDGENTTLYADGLHARSLDSAHHPSRTWVKALQARIGHAVPKGWRVCGENMFARHSIPTTTWTAGSTASRCGTGTDAAWTGTGRWRFCADSGSPCRAVLWRGVFDERALRALRLDLGRQEGYVVRIVDGSARRVRAPRREVGAGRARTDGHALDARGRRGERAGCAGPAVGGAFRRARRRGRAGGGRRAARRGGTGRPSPRFDAAGRTGDDRLVGVLAALLHARPGGPGPVAARLAGVVGMPLARRVADLVGLHPALHRPYPDEDRRTGLARLSPPPTSVCCTRSPAQRRRRTRRASRWSGRRCTPRRPGPGRGCACGRRSPGCPRRGRPVPGRGAEAYARGRGRGSPRRPSPRPGAGGRAPSRS